MRLSTRLGTLLLALALVAPAALADENASMGEGGDNAWTNPGKALPCEFFSGPLTVTGLIAAKGCNPDHDQDCDLEIEIVSIKQNTVRGWLAHDPDKQHCTLTLSDGRKRTIGPLWRRSEHGEKAVRVSGVVTDGVMGVSFFKVLGDADGLR